MKSKKLPLNYLQNLVKTLEQKTSTYKVDAKLMMLSGATMNWIADFVTSRNVCWSKRKMNLNALYLTGTNPDWNRVILDRCHRSPKELRTLFNTDKKVIALFRKAKYTTLPILVRVDDGKYKVLDGMNRVIAAIRDNKTTITAFVAKKIGNLKPQCEPHVVFDFLRVYQRGIYRNKKNLIAALRFLRKNYENVDELLKNRFNCEWLPDKKIQGVIKKVLRK